MNISIEIYEKSKIIVNIHLDNSTIERYHLTGTSHDVVLEKLNHEGKFWQARGYCKKYGELMVKGENLDFSEIMKLLEV